MMRRLNVLVLLLALLLVPAPAYAEDTEWTAEQPKGMSGGIACTGYAEAGGHSYRMTNWIGADADEDPVREAAWQRSYCDMIARTDVARFFLYHHGITIDPSTVKVTHAPVR